MVTACGATTSVANRKLVIQEALLPGEPCLVYYDGVRIGSVLNSEGGFRAASMLDTSRSHISREEAAEAILKAVKSTAKQMGLHRA